MAYQSLYRKYRSRDFTDLVGQRHVTQTLANAISGERVSHAYLFCGPRGTGKTSTARVLAKALNCENGPTATPCNACPACLSIKQGSAMDVIEIDAASNRNIDDIRQLREQVNYPPVELRYKFYIVDEVHQLTRDSFNAFLKTLEEPPGHVIFVLCTTDPHQLPATILSRCQRFDFHRIGMAEIVERLRWVVGQEGWEVDEEALQLIARTANGGMRDALSLLEQASSYAGPHITGQHVRDVLGGIDLELLQEVSRLIIARDANNLFLLIERIMSEGKDVPQLASELIQHWRNLLRVQIGGEDALVDFAPEQRRQMAEQTRETNQAFIMRALTLLCELENELRWNSQHRLLLELYSLRMMSEEAPAPMVTAPAPARPQAARPANLPPRPAVEVRETPPPPRREEAAPASAPVQPAAVATPVDGQSGLTLPQVKKSWPAFMEWTARSPKLEQLRVRILEKCWPSGVNDNTLLLTTASQFTRSQVYDRPRVKEILEQCLSTFFKQTLAVRVEVQSQETAPDAPAEEAVVPAPAPSPEPSPASPPAEAAPEPEEPARDIVGERMRKVFSGSEEVAE